MCVGSVPLDIASGATKAAGSIYAGKVANQVAQMNAGMADQNAAYSNRQAADAIDRGSEQVSQLYLQAGLLRGKQTAAMASNGVELGYGSAADVVADTSTLAEGDANVMRENASRAAEGYRIQSMNYLNQAATFRLNGTAAQFAGYLGAAGSILSTASQVDKDIMSAYSGGG